ncbi:glycosyltransferase family 1 protein [Cyanobium sp. N.Huapi 1H5]|uniref:glycosyltransferase n=1 Tax=Cyanobium sp. N.Huapi 1H5 TaxID=2823719 RepID=UPI0020CCBE08|nr:glycosyltransferase [Cyanobium sp. N.Huapi 1H5]MCP9837457.1 glycosyltransferase family 1 protein [Cyanobium sp. N.Huapi 1H5]
MKVLFSMHGEAGHHLGTFRLARALVSQGHRVTYLGLPRVRKLVEDQGFAFIAFAEDLFTAPGDGQEPPAADVLFRRYCSAIVDGTLDACLLAARPDLLLCDSFLWYVSLRALRLGIPTIQISTSLFLFDNARIPPAVTSLRPGRGMFSALRISLAWKLMHLRYLVTKRLASRLRGAYRAPLRMHHLTDTFLWVARRSGVRLRRNVTYLQDEIGPHLILPELVLCPAAFQLPGPRAKDRRHCGDFIDFQRQEPPLPFDPSGRTTILCSLGTSAGAYRQARRFFTAVAEASALAPEWFFVLHISDPALIGAFASSANLLVVPWISQLTLLRHAAVMVHHGGLNSIMECVQNDVPMVILPCARDQPGNAVRAAHHQLALTAEARSITAERLRQLVGEAMADPGLKRGLRRMKEQIERERGLQQAVAFIEAFTADFTAAGDIDEP